MARSECAFPLTTARGLILPMSRRDRRQWRLRTRIGTGLLTATLAGTVIVANVAAAPPATAGLLGSLLCPVVNTLTGVLGAGWDDGANTPPTTMAQVEQAIGASSLQAQGITGSGIGIAIVDSGVVPVAGLTGAGKVVNGPDLSFESQYADGQYLDTYGHGTHMAGIAAGNDGAGGSFKGVAPGARIVSLKVASHDGAADVSQVLAAIDWVVQHRNDPGMNIRVLNLSYGTAGLQSPQLDPIAFAVENAWRHGIVTVVAGGNDGTTRGSLTDPAMDPYVLATGAANLNGSSLLACASVAPFSSRSSSRSVDVIAPGVSIQSLRDPGSAIDQAHPGAVVDTRFFRGSGTSQAAAVLSGAVALLLQARPTLTPDQVKALLKTTAAPLALLDQRAEGSGMINVLAAANGRVPFGATQTWPTATGTGSIEQARGGSHVALNGVELTGEQDIMGQPWNGATWAQDSAAAVAWTGGTWNGTDWTGACLCATSWSGASWTGQSWTGQSWTGQSWTGKSWTGQSWTGQSWTGQSWTGKSWTSAAGR
ncbi:MAG: peptidase and in kexin sedolisin [Acidimicrobiales bacterium]|nr:peptidase and in kexin sedolisin [Acidimicrobiales bacterium]